MLVEHEHAPLPDDSAIEGLIAAMQAGTSSAVDVADELLMLSSREAHPRIKATLLEKAARLVMATDKPRAANLFRESFRLFPTQPCGRALVEIAGNEAAFRRLYRLGNLVDAIAALATGGPARVAGLLEAGRSHIAHGYGRAAVAALQELLTLDPGNSEAAELLRVGEQQIAERQQALTERRLALAECSESERAQALVAYAGLLLEGDEPLGDAAAVLADAIDSGADVEAVAPLWVEVARAMGDRAELTRALACSLMAGEALPTRLQHADELANIEGIDRQSPQAAALALGALSEALPDDPVITARMQVVGALLTDDPAREVEELRLLSVRDRDRQLEATASLALAWLARQAGDWTGAERHYRRVRTLAPQDTEALNFFETFYRQTGDHKRLMVALSQRLGASEGRETINIALEMAHLCEGPLASPERAIEAYQRVLTVQPDHDEALSSLQRLNESLQRWPALRDVLERQARTYIAKCEIDSGAKDLAVVTLNRMAELLNDPTRLADPEQAHLVLRRILQLDARHPEALAAVTAHLQAAGRYEQLVATLRAAAEASAEGGERGRLFSQAAEVASAHLAAPAQAAELWRLALQADPDNKDVAAKLRSAARQSGDTDSLLDSLVAELAGALGPHAVDVAAPLPAAVAPEWTETLEDAASLADAHGSRAELAGRLFALLALAEPGHLTALHGLIRHWTVGRAAELADFLQAQLALVRTDERRKAILEHLVQVRANGLPDPAGAEAAAQALRALDPTNALAQGILVRAAAMRADLTALRDLCGPGEAGLRSLVQVCLDAAADRDDQLRHALLRAAATVLDGELGDREQATLVLTESLQSALSEEPPTLSIEQRVDLGQALLNLAGQAGMLGSQRMAVEALLSWQDESQQPKLRLQLAELSAASGDVGEAMELLASVAEESLGGSQPDTFHQAVHRTVELSATLEDREMAQMFLARGVDLLELAAQDQDASAALGPRLFALWAESAHALARGEVAWELVLKCAQGALKGGADAGLLELCERAAAELDDWESGVAALQALAEIQTGDQRVATLLRAASILDTAGRDPVRTADLYRAALAIQPTGREAWAGLVAAVRASGDRTALALTLDEMLQKSTPARDSLARAVLERVELGAELQEPDPLAAAWNLVAGLADVAEPTETERTLLHMAAARLQDDAGKVELARRLTAALDRHGSPDERLLCCEILAFAEPAGSAARIDALLGLGASLAGTDPQRAWASVQAALTDAPTDAEIRARAAAIAKTAGVTDQLLAMTLAWAGQADVAGVAARPESEHPAILREAVLLAEGEGDLDQAVALAHAWHAAAPDDSASLRELERLSAAAGDTQTLHDALLAHTQVGTDQERAQAWLRLTADEPDLQVRTALLQGAVQELPAQAELWQAWLDSLRAGESQQALAAGLEQTLAVGALDDTTRIALRRELATVVQALGQPHELRAGRLWIEALEVDPADDNAAAQALQCLVLAASHGSEASELLALAERLDPIADARGEAQAVETLLGLRARLAESPAQRALAWRSIAQLRHASMGDPDAALEAAVRALALEPDHGMWLATTESFAREAVAAGTPVPEVVAPLEAAACECARADDRLSIRRAALKLMTTATASHALRPVLEGILADDPQDGETLGQLEALAVRDGDVDAQLALSARQIDRTSDPAAAALLWLQQAAVLQSVRKFGEAAAALERAAQSPDRQVRAQALEAMAELGQSQGDAKLLASALRSQREDAVDPEEQVALYLRVAQLLADAGHHQEAQAELRGGLQALPGSQILHATLEGWLSDAEDHAELAKHLEEAWTRLPDLDAEDADAMATRWLAAVKASHGNSAELVDAAVKLAGQDRALDAVTETLQDAAEEPALAAAALQALVDLKQRKQDATGEVAARLQRLYKSDIALDRLAERRLVAELMLNQLNEPEAALNQLQGLLDLPGWTDADADAVLATADSLGKAEDAEDVLGMALLSLQDDARRSAWHVQLAQRALARGDLERARDMSTQLSHDAPQDAATLAVVRALLQAQAGKGSTDDREAMLRHLVQHGATDGEKSQAALDLATLLSADSARASETAAFAMQAAQDPDLAGAAFDLVSGDTSGDPAVELVARAAAPLRLDAALWLEGQARDNQNWSELADLLAQRANRLGGEDQEAAVDAWLQLADLAQGELASPRRAADAVAQALQLDPHNETALQLSLGVAVSLGDHAQVAALAERLAELAEPAPAAELWLQRADALEVLGDHAGALDACELALVATDDSLAAYRKRTALLQKAGRASEALGVLRSDAARKTGALSATLWLDATELARAGGDATAWGECLALAIDAGAGAQAVSGELGHAKDGSEWRAAAGHSVASALARQGRHAEGLDLAFAALDPHGDLLGGLEQALELAKAADATEDWLEKAAEFIGSGEVVDEQLMAVVAMTAATAADLGFLDRGADLWDLAWEQRPDDPDARDAVLGLRRSAGDPHRLAACLERALVFAEGEQRLAFQMELAELRLRALGKPRESLRLISDILQSQPDNAEAVALLRELAGNPVAADEALLLLGPIARRRQDWATLSWVLQCRLTRSTTTAERTELAQELAAVQPKASAGEADSLRGLAAAVEAAPSPSLLKVLLGIARVPQDDAVVAGAYEAVLKLPLAAAEAAALLVQSATVQARLGNAAQAESQLRQAIKQRPEADEAVQALEALLDQQGRFTEVVVLLRERADKLQDLELRRLTLHRLVGLARTLGQREMALASLRELVDLDPGDREALQAAVDLLREDGSPTDLSESLVRLARAVDIPRERAELLCEAARLLPRGRDDQAVEDMYRESFDADPSLDEPFVWLERQVAQHPRHLAHLYEARAEALAPSPGRVATLRKLSHARRDVGDGQGACAALQQALLDDPANATVLDELLKTAEQLRVWSAWLVGAERRLAGDLRKEARIALLAQLARIALTELGNLPRAQEAADQLQQLAPRDPSLRQIQALLQSHSGNAAEAAAGLEQVVKETDDPQQLLALHQQLAELYLGDLDNPGRGIRELQRILAIDPRRNETRRRLCDLYRSRNSFEALAECLKQWLAALDDPGERATLPMSRGREIIDLLRELGEVHLQLGQPQEAAHALRRAWELCGDDVDVAAALAPLLATTGEAELAQKLHDFLAEHHKGDKAKMAQHLSQSALIHERRGDLAGARERFKRALESAPGNDEATLGSARVCLALGEVDRAMRLFDAVARRPGAEADAQVSADAHVGMGKCRLARNQRDQARACFEEALELVPGHKAAAEALATL